MKIHFNIFQYILIIWGPVASYPKVCGLPIGPSAALGPSASPRPYRPILGRYMEIDQNDGTRQDPKTVLPVPFK